MNRLLILASNFVMPTSAVGLLSWLLLLLPVTSLRAELYQWTDARGTIHFTDNLHTVPGLLRNSPHLIIRQDSWAEKSSLSSTPPETLPPEEALSPKEVEPMKAAPPIIHYNPQQITIVVVNTIVSRPKDRICIVGGSALDAQWCRPVPRFNFDDRRYIHPSVFNGGSRQFIQPELFPPTRR